MTKKERVEDLIKSLEEFGVRNISTESAPQINAEEVSIPFGAIPGLNNDQLKLNYTIMDEAFIVFLGPLYKCDSEHIYPTLLEVNRLNQNQQEKFYMDDYGNVLLSVKDYYINNSMQLAGEFVHLFQKYINEDFVTSLRNRIEK